jgi:glycosyltransferase involved in cell wall biosynthesis
MRVLVLSTAPREPDNHLLWEGLRNLADVEVYYFTKEQQKRMGRLLSQFDFSRYDRVVCDLLFRYLVGEVRRLARVQGLVIYEEDACQEFILGSKWRGRFSDFYRRLPSARVIFTGHQVCEKFKLMGVDAHFLPKGYDSSKLYDTGRSRDIELGFVGRLGSDAYRERKKFLERAVTEHGLQILRTDPGDAYREALNRIRIFVSADIGLGEYMAKNFEAMACGCVLIAYQQGAGEEEALGLEDGRQVLLYRDYAEFSRLLKSVVCEPERLSELARAASTYARQRFDYVEQSRDVMTILIPALTRSAQNSSIFQRLSRLFGD